MFKRWSIVILVILGLAFPELSLGASYTPNLRLKKPTKAETGFLDAHNSNMQVLDTKLNEALSAVPVSSLAYGTSILGEWIADPSITSDQADATTAKSLAKIISDLSGASVDLRLPAGTYYIWRNYTVPATSRLKPDNGAILTPWKSIRETTYKWTASGSGTSEYYLEIAAGGAPGVYEPTSVYANSIALTAGTAGSLTAGQWVWDDNDSLGYSTIYVRLADSADPDGKTAGYVEAWYTLTINGPFSAGLYQVFSGSGTVTFGAGAIDGLPVEWFGTVGDCTLLIGGTPTGTNDSAAIQKAIDCLPVGAPLLLTKKYLVTSAINLLKSRITIRGTTGYTNDEPLVSAPALCSTNLDSIFVVGDYGVNALTDHLFDFKFENVNFYGDGSASAHTVNFKGMNGKMVFGALFEKCFFQNFSGAAIYTDNNATVDTGYVLHNLKLRNCGAQSNVGVVGTHANSYIVDFSVEDCSLHQNVNVLNGAFRGYVDINRNKLEGSSDEAITIRATPARYPCNVRLTGNYFEANAGDYLVSMDGTGLTNSSFYSSGNTFGGTPSTGLPSIFYLLTNVLDVKIEEGTYVTVAGNNLKFSSMPSYGNGQGPRIIPKTTVYPITIATFPAGGARLAPTADKLDWSTIATAYEADTFVQTPFGEKLAKLRTTAYGGYTIARTIDIDEMLVATVLVQYPNDLPASANPAIVSLYDNTGTPVLIAEGAITLSSFQFAGGWRLISICYTPTAAPQLVQTLRFYPYGTAGSGTGAYLTDMVAYHYNSAATYKSLIPWMVDTGITTASTTFSHDYGAGTTAWTLTLGEAAARSFATTNAGGSVNAILPAGFKGTFYVNNTSGQTVTWKYAASTGVANATAKKAIMTADGAEVYAIKADY